MIFNAKIQRTGDFLFSDSLCVFLYFLVLIQTQEIPRFVSLKTAELGDNVTLYCRLDTNMHDRNILHWYKQSLGYVPQMVGAKVFGRVTIYSPFNSSFTAEKKGPDFTLTIRSVNKEDEANYFCTEQYTKDWIGIFLSVKGLFSVS